MSGRIGDNNHAFGPLQANDAGGVLTGKFPNLTPEQKNAWAWSPEGINFVLQGVAHVAKGLTGKAAVNAIVRQYERPADPEGEVARALSAYGGSRGNAQGPTPMDGMGPFSGPPAAGPAQGVLSGVLGQVFNSNNALLGVPSIDFSAFTAPPAAKTVTAPSSQPTMMDKPVKGKTIPFIEHFAAPFGLTVTSTTGGKHANGSYHYQGRAVDFGGDANRMAALANAALEVGGWKELLYTGPGNTGFSILRGKVVPNSSLPKALYDEHTNHVHIAK